MKVYKIILKSYTFHIWEFQIVDCSNYAHYVFATIDTNSDGTVNFEVSSTYEFFYNWF